MRDIKFRAWNRTTREMHKDIHKSHLWRYAIEQDDCRILMQYTGLKDKNGKEIYEGDIVRWQTELGSTPWNWQVKYRTHGAYFCFITMTGKERSLEEHKNVEIIGNIYENPELLNKI